MGLIALLLAAANLLGPRVEAAQTAPPVTINFDHLSTGFELDGVHRDLPCESCHINAVFKGTPRNCGTCHITGSPYNATPKVANHVPSSNNCAACHNTIAFRPEVHFDHAEVMGSCVSCHNGSMAQGKGPTHPATSDSCAACHTVVGWNPPTAVDHSQIPLAVAGFCIICHNGTQAAGKPANHIATNLECGDCHTTSTWLGANFDHTGITANCFSCHNGAKAVGKQGNHMPTSNTCENCHTTGIGTKTPSWVPSKFDHTQMSVATCATCHSGTVKISTGFVSGQPANHVPPIPSSIDCSVCHGNTPTAETWDVLAAGIATLHSGLTVTNCLMCHASQTFAGKPAPYIPMSISGVSPYKSAPLSPPHLPVLAGTDCSACHGAAYQTGGFGPATAMTSAKHAFVSSTCTVCHDTGKSFYVGGGTALQLRPADHISSADPNMVSGDCSMCHSTIDWTSNALPAGHLPNPGNLSCTQCHAKAPSDYTPATLAAVPALHGGITNNCGLCHGNNVSALTWFSNFTPKDAILTPAHIPYLTGTDCSSCHTANYVTGGFGPTAMNPAKHAFVPASCDTCHEAGLSLYLGASTPPLQGRPADHVAAGGQQAGGDCSGCHNTVDWTSNTYPPGHMPNPGNQACKVCHIAIGSTLASYDALATVAVLHTGITGGCSQCHGNNVAALTWTSNYTPKDAILTPAHIPYLTGSDCSSCHARNYVTGGFGPTAMSAAKHSFVPTSCDTCHEAGLSFYLGTSTPPLQGRPADHVAAGGQQSTGDCSGCHNTTDWSSNAMPAGHMPNPGNQACKVCHTAIGSTLASYATLAGISVLHTGIASGCQACHGSPSAALTFYNNNDNPKAAAGLSPAHIPYLNGVDCVSCHATNYTAGGFGPATGMSAAKHAFVPTTCDTCHESGLSFYPGAALNLQGRPPTHVSAPNPASQATGDCSLCHNTTTWNAPSTLPNGHMPIPGTQTCSVCHTGTLTADPTSYAQLASIAVLHTGITSGCAQCHGGATQLTFYNNNDNPKAAASLSPAHIPAFTGQDCGSCHKANYVAGGFGPMNMTQATHAGVGTTCKNCHEAGLNFYMGAATPTLQGRPADHTGSEAAPADCGLCHTTANWNSTALPAGHMPNPGNQACAVCHTGSPSNYATMASIAALHTGISNGCATCHGTTQLTFYNNNDNPKSAVLTPAHIPILSGTDCGTCHKANYVAGGFGPMNMTQASHASVSTKCITCHEKGLSFYMGAASPALQGRPADHTSGQMVAPNDCSLCHTTANWNSTALPAGHMPNPGNQGCTVCHTAAPGNYTTLAANAVLHTGITSGCITCHAAPNTATKVFYNNFSPKSAVLSPVHIPSAGTACENCHAVSFTTFSGTTMSATKHTALLAATGNTCDQCHDLKTLSFYGVTNLTTRPNGHHTGQDCNGCHTPRNWDGNAQKATAKIAKAAVTSVVSAPAGTATASARRGIGAGNLRAGIGDAPGERATRGAGPASAIGAGATATAVPSHIGVTSNCASCHNGTLATGKGPRHIQSDNSCQNCHTTLAWLPARFDHRGVTASCASCHNGAVAAGKPPKHVPTALDCSACHGVISWSVARFNHLGIGATCGSCHNGITAAGKPIKHVVTAQDCAGCHNIQSWDIVAPRPPLRPLLAPPRAKPGSPPK
jgi:hypothetical protein